MQEKSAHDAQCTPFLILSSQNLKIENKYVNKIDKTTQKGTDAARSLHINLRDTAAAYHSMLSLDLMRQSFYEVNFDHQLHLFGNIL